MEESAASDGPTIPVILEATGMVEDLPATTIVENCYRCEMRLGDIARAAHLSSNAFKLPDGRVARSMSYAGEAMLLRAKVAMLQAHVAEPKAEKRAAEPGAEGT